MTKKTYSKTFANRKSMMSYYYKVNANPKVKSCSACYNLEKGYMVEWSY